MIALLRGRIAHRESNRAIVDVGGVGYEVFAPNRSIEAWSRAEADVTVHVSTQVREDAITLYGFEKPLDRQAFQVLIGVSGIGPKLALACLDAMPLEQLVRAVEGDDHGALGQVSGVGKKTAQRLVLELKGKLPMSFEPRAAASPTLQPAAQEDTLVLALLRLGYTRPEIERVRVALEREGVPADAPVADRLRAALKLMYGSDR